MRNLGYLERLISKNKKTAVPPPKKTGLLPIMHEDRFKLFWDVLLILSLVIYALIFPFAEHFLTDEMQTQYLFQYENLITVQFMLDIGINFVTAYVDDHKRVITNLHLVF